MIQGWDALCRGEPIPAATNTRLDQQEQAERSAGAQPAVILKDHAVRARREAGTGRHSAVRWRRAIFTEIKL